MPPCSLDDTDLSCGHASNVQLTQTPRADFHSHRNFGNDSYPQTDFNELLYNLDTPELHRDSRLNAGLKKNPIRQAATRASFLERQERFP